MKDPLKPRDKVIQRMTRDGLVEENRTKGTAERVSKRENDEFRKPQEQPPQEAAQPDPLSGLTSDKSPLPHAPGSAAPKDNGGMAERVAERIDAEHTRRKSKKAVKKAHREARAKTQSSRLQFTEEELSTPELQKYIEKSNKAADRLDEARAAIPKKKHIVKERTFDEALGKPKVRLHFEEREKPPPKGGTKKSPLSRPAQEAGLYVHNKIHSVEKENSGVEGAHKSEEVAERMGKYGIRKVKQGYRSHKLKPYRAAAKAEKAAAKANVNYQYHKVLYENPQFASNPVSRLWQKRQIKRSYAKAARNGGKKGIKAAAENTRKAAAKAAEKTKQTVAFVARHPAGVCAAVAVLLLFIMIMAGFSSCSAMFSGSLSSVAGSSYVSDDADMTGAEADYAGLEAELQREIDNIERTHPGHDEYRYDLDEIKHDPYVLTSILTALKPGYTRAEVQSMLQMLFERQYVLTLTEEVEVRYRTETHTDSEGNEYEVEVPYNYYILNVELENRDLSHIPVEIMTEEQLSMYALYMQTLGNRPDLFPQGQYPNASGKGEFEDYEIPPEALEDETFAAMVEEAEKYLGFPYVWGGSSPSTSFDCSGFISWVINHSGWNVGRQTANGLLNICTPVSSANAQPGDLIFFQGTYDTAGASHVGLYVGNNMMIHCGDPISYANIGTSYWQSHFYTFGRLP